jgi:hypothetical protein
VSGAKPAGQSHIFNTDPYFLNVCAAICLNSGSGVHLGPDMARAFCHSSHRLAYHAYRDLLRSGRGLLRLDSQSHDYAAPLTGDRVTACPWRQREGWRRPGMVAGRASIPSQDPHHNTKKSVKSLSQKTPKPSKEDFKDIREWYKMEFAFYSFEAARDIIKMILDKGLDHRRSLEYYAMSVGLICIYARPFTNNEPVGKLSEEIVPEQFKHRHTLIMALRHRLFAHADATLAAAPDNYPNEAVIVNDGEKLWMDVSRSAVVPSLLEKMQPLVNGLIDKTNYHRRKYAKKFSKEVAQLGKGEFRLNVVDSAAPLFAKLSEAERRVRREKKSLLDPNSDFK